MQTVRSASAGVTAAPLSSVETRLAWPDCKFKPTQSQNGREVGVPCAHLVVSKPRFRRFWTVLAAPLRRYSDHFSEEARRRLVLNNRVIERAVSSGK